MNPTLLSILSALGAATWSMWTWKSEREKEREAKSDEYSSQFVNSFLIVGHELQKRLHNILDSDELSFYKSEYPDPAPPASPAAIDLLFLFGLFCGWQLVLLRFGPYTKDATVFGNLARIADVLENRKRFAGKAFRFTPTHRHALGSCAVRHFGDSTTKPSFWSTSRYQFEKDLLSESGEWHALFQSETMRCTLAAIDKADSPEKLEGRERLIAFQNHLVDLLSYLERKEGFKLAVGERSKARHIGKPDIPGGSQRLILPSSSDVRILHETNGRVRIGIPRINETAAATIATLLESQEGATTVRVNAVAACVVVTFSPTVSQADFINGLVAQLQAALHDETPNGGAPETVRANVQKKTRQPG